MFYAAADISECLLRPLNMTRPAGVFVTDFCTGPCLCELCTVPPKLRFNREFRVVQQHGGKPIPAIIGATTSSGNDAEFFNQSTDT